MASLFGSEICTCFARVARYGYINYNNSCHRWDKKEEKKEDKKEEPKANGTEVKAESDTKEATTANGNEEKPEEVAAPEAAEVKKEDGDQGEKEKADKEKDKDKSKGGRDNAMICTLQCLPL